MRKYEVMYILNATKGEEEVKGLVEKFTNLISENGEIEKNDALGTKQLAYEIQDQKEGYYQLTTFSANAEFPQELERQFKITDGVLKYLVIRLDA